MMKIIKGNADNKVNLNSEYKLINKNWNTMKVSDLFMVLGGGTPSTKEDKYWNGSFPWIGPAQMGKKNNKFISVGERFLSEDGVKKLGNKKIIKGSLIISTRAPIGYLKIAKNDLYTNQGCHSLISKNKNLVIEDFFYYYFLSNNYILEKYSSGSTFKELSKKSLSNIEVFLPDLKQQEKIASVLSKQERQIEIIEKLIEKLETRNQYYAEKLLSGEKRIRKNEQGEIEFYDNTEWQDVSLNGKIVSIPKGWAVEKVGNISKTKTGKKNANEGSETGVYKFFTCSKEDKLINNFSFDQEAILISGNGIVGLNKYYKGKFDAYQRVYVLGDFSFDAIYLNHYISIYFKSSIENNIKGAVINYIRLNDITDFEFIYSENEKERNKIKDFLKIKYNEKEIMEKLLIKEKLRFQWMLDNLLSGEYQIVD